MRTDANRQLHGRDRYRQRVSWLPRAWLDELLREINPVFRDVRPRRTVVLRRAPARTP
ncbi:MAG: hypothetical protein AB7K24_12440 [Gemmataceae bacterium]